MLRRKAAGDGREGEGLGGRGEERSKESGGSGGSGAEDGGGAVRHLGPVLWTGLPELCPTCGARVDTVEVSRALKPGCRYCNGPLHADAGAVDLAPHPGGTKVLAQVHMLSAAQGGRRTPTFSGYRPTVALGEGRHGCELVLEGVVMLVPGDTVTCAITFSERIAVAEGDPLDILEGDHLVAHAVVLRVA